MPRVSATVGLPCSVYEAETVWYDTTTWPSWVDQLAEVVEVSGPWPDTGAAVVWESGPAGRGRVQEIVSRYEARVGQENEVEDSSIHGLQSVSFGPAGEGTMVTLSLDYTLKRRSPLNRLVDLLFIRRLMGASLSRTLSQFAATVAARR